MPNTVKVTVNDTVILGNSIGYSNITGHETTKPWLHETDC